MTETLADVTGATGLRIIRAIVSGNTDPAELAEFRDVRCKASPETIREALVGNYRRGERRPETFDFLGFTHYCARIWVGCFMVLRKTQRKRMTTKLKELRRQMRRRMHRPVREQGEWLTRVLRGHYAY